MKTRKSDWTFFNYTFLFSLTFASLVPGLLSQQPAVNIPNAIQFLDKFRNKLLELAGDAAAGISG